MESFNLWANFPMVGHMMDTVAHADELAGRAAEAVHRHDLQHAVADFERSLREHASAAVQTAGQAINARLRGDDFRANVLGPQAAILLWQIPGRARIAAGLLRSIGGGTPGLDPAEPLRFIAEKAVRRPEAIELLGDTVHGRLASAVKIAFIDCTPAPPVTVERTLSRPEPARSAMTTPPSILSRREREVLCGIADGLTNRGIAAQLGIKGITVNTFVSRIFGKLNLDNRAAAAAYAVRNDMCESS